MTGYGGATIKQIGVRVKLKACGIVKVEIYLSHCRCTRPSTARIEDPETNNYVHQALYGLHRDC